MNAAEPAVVEAGASEVSPVAALMVKGNAGVTPLLALTVTCAVPAAATSVARIAAVSCVALTNVVVRADPFHCTTAPDLKFCPFTVSVNAAEPAVVEAGASEVSVAAPLATP